MQIYAELLNLLLISGILCSVYFVLSINTNIKDCSLTSRAGWNYWSKLPLLLDLSQDPVMEGLLLWGRRREAAL